ncbi:MAG: hypothetical protein HC903_17315 [Methylacidiphilales bacterium]|nr:hypothetical protein [Candidatus Methylacidiphilales bacterium]NJR16250.1 hypothetical protein [Calothrix sp. CSU_2_0]
MLSEKETIKVNKILGKQAGLGPIPANQILPWFAIITISYFIFDGLLGWGIPKVFVISFWLIISWWFVTGKDPDKYVNRFRKPKGKNWMSGGAVYISPLISRQIRNKFKNERR